MQVPVFNSHACVKRLVTAGMRAAQAVVIAALVKLV